MDTTDETITLISAGKVQGTPVFSTDGESLGEIYDVMLEKRSGRIAYAVLAFGGVLGLDKQYLSLPWMVLKYDSKAGGYVVGIPIDALSSGPEFDNGATWNAAMARRIDSYYQAWTATV